MVVVMVNNNSETDINMELLASVATAFARYDFNNIW